MGSRNSPSWPSNSVADSSEFGGDDAPLLSQNGGQFGSMSGTVSQGANGNLPSPRRSKINRGSLGGRGVALFDDLESGTSERPIKDRIFSKWRNQALISGLAYCVCSCSMILLNKVVLSSYNFEAGISLMCYQNLVSVVVVFALSVSGIISTEPISWKLVFIWFPVNLIFVGMLVSSIFSLKYMNVAMVTILKNITNLITAVGEVYLFSKRHNSKVWGSLLLMVVSAIFGGFTDLSFHSTGYTWQIVNCFMTAAYSLTLRKVMDLAKQSTKSGTLSEFSMVLLNNSLSLPLGLALILLFKETDYLQTSPVIKLPMFWVLSTLSGLFGLAISFTSMWFLHQTGPTTYSLVGSLNKIPLSIAGILIFKVPTSSSNLLSIFFGLFAGVMFARAKMS
ncbi:hypothetical protein L7F22_021077 [Adiantum nelumboides]|nr:hypothetical protein [Adiantum nelumboides]